MVGRFYESSILPELRASEIPCSVLMLHAKELVMFFGLPKAMPARVQAVSFIIAGGFLDRRDHHAQTAA